MRKVVEFDIILGLEVAVFFLPAAKHAGQGIIKCQLEEEELSKTFVPNLLRIDD